MDKRFIIRNQNALAKISHFEEVLRTMQIPQKNVYILLDDGEYPEYPNHRYKRAFCMDIQIGGIEEFSPPHILDIMRRPDCKHFVWVSPSVANADCFHATWVFAHELKHLVQDLQEPDLAKVTTFMKLALPIILRPNKLNQLDVPGELDAEIQAKRITVQIFGEKAYEEFVKFRICLDGEIARNYYKKFQDLESKWSGNFRHEIFLLLSQYKQEFIVEQTRLNQSGNDFDFDINRLCGS